MNSSTCMEHDGFMRRSPARRARAMRPVEFAPAACGAGGQTCSSLLTRRRVRPPWGVAALLLATGDALAARFGAVAVRGEISGFNRAASGHCYFALKDADGAPALLRCAMFRRAAGWWTSRHRRAAGRTARPPGRVRSAWRAADGRGEPAARGQPARCTKSSCGAGPSAGRGPVRQCPQAAAGGHPRRLGVVTSPSAAACAM
jgi:exodeoxyribonuclease VII large subunit